MIAPGTPVQLTRGPMGCMIDPDSSQFTDTTAPTGTRGRYLKPHGALPDWHILALSVAGDVLFCPVGDGQFITLPDHQAPAEAGAMSTSDGLGA